MYGGAGVVWTLRHGIWVCDSDMASLYFLQVMESHVRNWYRKNIRVGIHG
jgi:hypothetical protein